MKRGLILGVLLLAGCTSGGGEPQENQAPASQAAPEGAPSAKALDLDLVVDALCAELEGREWPPSIPCTSEQPPRPYVRITTIHDRTRETFDVRALLNELENRLYAQGVVWLVAEASSGFDDLHTDRDYSGSGQSPAPKRAPTAGLELTGQITGSTSAGFTFQLELRNVRTGKVEAQTDAVFSKVATGG